MAIERFGDLHVFDALEDDLGQTLTPRRGHRRRDGDHPGAARRGERLARRARARPRAASTSSSTSTIRCRLVRVPRADRADPRARRRPRPARRKPRRHGGRDGWRASFAEGPPCEVCGERCKRAQSRGSARSPTQATATPTAASRSRRRAVRARRPRAVARRARRRLRALRRPARSCGAELRDRCRRMCRRRPRGLTAAGLPQG